MTYLELVLMTCLELVLMTCLELVLMTYLELVLMTCLELVLMTCLELVLMTCLELVLMTYLELVPMTHLEFALAAYLGRPVFHQRRKIIVLILQRKYVPLLHVRQLPVLLDIYHHLAKLCCPDFPDNQCQYPCGSVQGSIPMVTFYALYTFLLLY